MTAAVLVLIQALAPEAERTVLGPGALAFMLVSMGAVTLLTGWCFLKILRGQRHFDPDGTGPAHSPEPGELEKPPRDRR
jgi:hypothetical protein